MIGCSSPSDEDRRFAFLGSSLCLLYREIAKIITLPDIKGRMATLGFETVGTTPDESRAQFRAEIDKWAKVIRDAGIKAN
jgi:tripartite-type tricarboxylate transporter receptor subunit TctC